MTINKEVRQLIKAALKEDAPRGDITSDLFVDPKQTGVALIIAKQYMVVCGLDVAREVFKETDSSLKVKYLCKEGQKIREGQQIMEVFGNKRAILKAERVALNFLQHLSGVATMTNELGAILKKSKTKLLDTRKTIPGLRQLQKYAVKTGGGENHRLNLSEMILIKENHLQGISNQELEKKIEQAKQKGIKIEIECTNLQDLESFLKLKPDIIMLDNMMSLYATKSIKESILKYPEM